MTFRPDTLRALLDHGFDTIIDVRAPSEHAEDRIPGAISLPVLDDDERARVGTIYTRESPFRARKIGAALVARNAARHIEGPLADRDGGWRPLVYCWRGGQRSNSFASILQQIGWRVAVLEGGYRTYRRMVVSTLYDAPVAAPVVALDGFTGTAKTAILHRVAALGAQVLDLEGTANHRGSLFGAMPGGQPSQKLFEGRLAAALARLEPGRPVLVEAESSKVGECRLPPRLWQAMAGAPRIVVEAPLAARAAYLARAYADVTADPAALADRIERLRPLQPAEVIGRWHGLAAAGDFEALAADLMDRHYDPRYAKSRARHGGGARERIMLDSLDDAALDAAAGRIAGFLAGFAAR